MEYLSLGRFTCGVDDYFLCISCHGVVYNPQECSVCEDLICKSCGLNLETCPSCSSELVLKETSKYASTTYSQLTLRCRNYLQGCDQEGLIEETIKHQESCEYEAFNCANPLCQTKKILCDKYRDDPFVCSENCRLISSFDRILKTGNQDLILTTLQAYLKELKARELEEVTQKLKKNIEVLDEKLKEKEGFYLVEKELRSEIELRMKKVHIGKWNVHGKYWVCCLNKNKLAIGCKSL